MSAGKSPGAVLVVRVVRRLLRHRFAVNGLIPKTGTMPHEAVLPHSSRANARRARSSLAVGVSSGEFGGH